MTTNDKGTQGEKPQFSSRTRSPAYPAIDLQTAIERAAVVWDHEQRNAAPLEVLAAHWETNPKSSTCLLAIAALKRFGLMEEVEGEARALKLTPLALNIILHEKDAPEREALLKRAALEPKIHRELWDKYNGSPPSDANIRHALIMEYKFNADSIPGFIAQFRSTIGFAKLTPADKVEAHEQQDEESTEAVVTKPKIAEFRAPRPSDVAVAAFVPSQIADIVAKSFGGGHGVANTVIREFTFPVPSGTVVLKVPFPMSESDFDTLRQTLEMFRPGMVKTETPTVQTSDMDWEQQAEAIAAAGVAFNLVGFSYARHIGFYNAIAIKYDLTSSFDPSKGIAWFKPKNPKT